MPGPGLGRGLGRGRGRPQPARVLPERERVKIKFLNDKFLNDKFLDFTFQIRVPLFILPPGRAGKAFFISRDFYFLGHHQGTYHPEAYHPGSELEPSSEPNSGKSCKFCRNILKYYVL